MEVVLIFVVACRLPIQEYQFISSSEFSSHRVEKMEKLELVGLQIFNNFFCERLLVKSGNLRSTINIVLVKTKRCRRKI